MQTSSLVHHLIDLNTSETERSADSVLAPYGATHSASRMATADAAGFERGRLSAQADVRQLLAEQEARFVRQRATDRQQWVDAQSSVLASRLDEGVAAVRQELAATISKVIVPFIVARLTEQAVGDLVAAADDLVKDSMPLTIEVSGPTDLRAEVVRRLEPLATVVRASPEQATELRVRVDDKILESRLTDWIALIEDVLR